MLPRHFRLIRTYRYTPGHLSMNRQLPPQKPLFFASAVGNQEKSMVEQQDVTIAALLAEDRTFPPPPEFAANANVRDTSIYERASVDLEGFWAEEAKTLDWFKPWDKVLEWDLPFAKWFTGGQINVSYNCLDRHVASGKGD